MGTRRYQTLQAKYNKNLTWYKNLAQHDLDTTKKEMLAHQETRNNTNVNM